MADFRGHEATTHKKRDSLIIQHCVLYLAHILLLVSFVFQRSNLVAQFHWGHFPSFVHQSKQRHKVFFARDVSLILEKAHMVCKWQAKFARKMCMNILQTMQKNKAGLDRPSHLDPWLNERCEGDD
jgi:hypothetical protein